MKILKILVACEFSGIVRSAFRKLGHDAWSCDIIDSLDNSPYHYKCDVREILNKNWDLMVAHPTCTYLTNAGVRHLHSVPSRNGVLCKVHGEERWKEMFKGAAFFNELKNAPIPHIAIENPVPHKYAKEIIGQYDQLVRPIFWKNPETKAICLWLKNLPKLTYSKNDIVPIEKREHNIHGMGPCKDRGRMRSIFFPEVADQMAIQWSEYILNKKD